MSGFQGRVTRRQLVAGAATGVAAGLTAGGANAAATGPAAARRPPDQTGELIPLPSPAQIRADFQKMVEFGSRLTGSAGHNAYIEWLEEELIAAGVELKPCSSYELTRWEVGEWALDLLDGPAKGPVNVAAYYPRCQETPAAGVTGPFVYGGVAPVPAINLGNLGALGAALADYPAQLESFVSGLTSTLGGSLQGSILLVDLPLPLPLTTGAFLPLATYLQWPGHSIADWIDVDYKRAWIIPGLALPLAPFQALGAAGVVFILDASFAAISGGYMPFLSGFQPLPALYVDRDTGTKLRSLTSGRPKAKMTVTATRAKVRSPSIVGVMHGAKSENLILNTHTDGEGFAEESAGVCLVHLARHFGSLPEGQRLSRSLVFSLFTGHMDPELPELQGFIDDNPELVAEAAAGLTIEHFGCSEWIDDANGYHPTGQAEMLGVWTTQGDMLTVTRDALEVAGLPKVALLRPPVQFGVGAAFQGAGVPQIGAIAGPTYLLTISDNGDLDKLDEDLGAAQVAWIADIMRRLEGYTAAQLRQGDPTLGGSKAGAPGSGGSGFELAGCAPPAGRPAGQPAGSKASHRAKLICSVGRHDRRRWLTLTLHISAGELHGLLIRVEHRGHVVARTHLATLGTRRRTIRLRPLHRGQYAPGEYELVFSRADGHVLLRRAVRI